MDGHRPPQGRRSKLVQRRRGPVPDDEVLELKGHARGAGYCEIRNQQIVSLLPEVPRYLTNGVEVRISWRHALVAKWRVPA